MYKKEIEEIGRETDKCLGRHGIYHIFDSDPYTKALFQTVFLEAWIAAKNYIAQPSAPKTVQVFGVPFTQEQMAACVELPKWELNPPQREEYESDSSYAIDLREYADKIIAAEKIIAAKRSTDENKHR